MSIFTARLFRFFCWSMAGVFIIIVVPHPALAQRWINGPIAAAQSLVFELADVEIVELREIVDKTKAPRTFRLQVLNDPQFSLKFQKKGNIIFFFTETQSKPLKIKMEIGDHQNIQFRSQKVKVTQWQSTRSRWDIVANSVEWSGECQVDERSSIQKTQSVQGGVSIYAPRVKLAARSCEGDYRIRSAEVDLKLAHLNGAVQVDFLRGSIQTDTVANFKSRGVNYTLSSKGLVQGSIDIEQGSVVLESHEGRLLVSTQEAMVSLNHGSGLSKVDITGDSPALTLKKVSDSKISLTSISGVIQCSESLSSHWSEVLRTCSGIMGDGKNRVSAKLNAGRIRFK